MHYTYRCTTDKLGEAIDKIEASGDHIVLHQFVGGRDWILLCRKGRAPDRYARAIREHTEALQHLRRVVDGLGGKVEAAAEKGTRQGASDRLRVTQQRARSGR